MNFPPRYVSNTRMRRMRKDDFSRRLMPSALCLKHPYAPYA